MQTRAPAPRSTQARARAVAVGRSGGGCGRASVRFQVYGTWQPEARTLPDDEPDATNQRAGPRGPAHFVSTRIAGSVPARRHRDGSLLETVTLRVTTGQRLEGIGRRRSGIRLDPWIARDDTGAVD